jgi:hypothetical protein
MKTLMIALLVLIVFWLVLERRASSSAFPIQVLYRQSARYAVAAALKDVVTAEEFKKATGADLLNFEREIARIQDHATLRLVKGCPKLVPEENPNLLEAMYQ